MSKVGIAEAIQVLKREFAERYGMIIRIDIYVHDANEELASRITRDMMREFRTGVYERCEKDGFKWKSWRDNIPYSVGVTVFHQEGETDEDRVQTADAQKF